MIKKFLKNIFSIKKGNNHKIITVLGLKLKIKQPQQVTMQDIKTIVAANNVHQNLKKYCNIYNDRSIAIVGGGATLNCWDKNYLKDDCIYIGINRAFKMEKIKFDYLFAQDRFQDKENLKQFAEYYPETCKKFIGYITASDETYRFRMEDFYSLKNKELYILDNHYMGKIPYSILFEPVADLHGTVFSALQFAFLTNPSKIYLLGFDCNVSHSFEKDVSKMNLSYQYKSWQKIKEFQKKYLDKIEIISINPVGLKGMFKDVYTQNYLDEHPEINASEVEILKEK